MNEPAQTLVNIEALYEQTIRNLSNEQIALVESDVPIDGSSAKFTTARALYRQLEVVRRATLPDSV